MPAVPVRRQVSLLTTEIAELTGKAHRNVMRDTRAMLTELHGEGGQLSFEQSYRAGNGKMEPCFSLPRRELMIRLAGYSIPLRAAVIDRLARYEAELFSQIAAPSTVTMTDRAESFMAAHLSA